MCVRLLFTLKVPPCERSSPHSSSSHSAAGSGLYTDNQVKATREGNVNGKEWSLHYAQSKAPVSWCELEPLYYLHPWCAAWFTHSSVTCTNFLFKAFIIVKAASAFLKVLVPLSLNGICLYTDPNSAIQPSYFSRSAADTDLEIFLSVRVKSSIVTGICSSSLDRARISSGLRPWIRRRMAIMDASLM